MYKLFLFTTILLLGISCSNDKASNSNTATTTTPAANELQLEAVKQEKTIQNTPPTQNATGKPGIQGTTLQPADLKQNKNELREKMDEMRKSAEQQNTNTSNNRNATNNAPQKNNIQQMKSGEMLDLKKNKLKSTNGIPQVKNLPQSETTIEKIDHKITPKMATKQGKYLADSYCKCKETQKDKSVCEQFLKNIDTFEQRYGKEVGAAYIASFKERAKSCQ